MTLDLFKNKDKDYMHVSSIAPFTVARVKYFLN